jgi:flagellar hook protein FlgE
MAFNIDSTSINQAAKRLDVIGNNISNSNNVGYKASEFSEVLAATSNVASRQSFTQGTITKTANVLDLAISGSGFLSLKTANGQPTFIRTGEFRLNMQGEIVNALGDKLCGYLVDPLSGKTQPSNTPVPLSINRPKDPPKASTTLAFGLNLDAREPLVPTTPVFSPTNPTTFNHFTSASVYDAQGKEVSIQTFYAKTADSTWDLYVGIGGAAPVKRGTLAFDTSGAITSSVDAGGVATANKGVFGLTIGTQTVQLDLSNTVQYGSAFSVSSQQDGRTDGTMLDYSVAEDGFISVRYTNGNTVKVGQVVLADFRALDGLKQTSNGQWTETVSSGPPTFNTPTSPMLGSLKSFGVEQANVDLTSEMIKMIAAQRAFEAQAETVKKQDEVMQTVINIGR